MTSSPVTTLITSQHGSLLREEVKLHKKLYISLATLIGHTLWVLTYLLLIFLPSPLYSNPSNTGPPLHVAFVIAILILRGIVQVIRNMLQLLQIRKRIEEQDVGLQRRRLNLPAYRVAASNGLMEGLLAGSVGEALVDGSAV